MSLRQNSKCRNFANANLFSVKSKQYCKYAFLLNTHKGDTMSAQTFEVLKEFAIDVDGLDFP